MRNIFTAVHTLNDKRELAQVKRHHGSLGRCFLSICAGFTLLISPLSYGATADQWLERFSDAMHRYDYHGVLVYSREGQLNTVELSHDVSEKGEKSRLSYLDGLPREFLHQDDQITRKISGQEVASDQIHGGNLLGRFSGGLPKIKQYYQLQVKGTGRIVGRQVQIIEVTPRDNQRLGYRLWLDEESALLLKSVTLDPLARELETFQFASFKFSKRDVPLAQPDTQHEALPDVKLPWLPDGFKLSAVKTALPVSETHRADMYNLSDGVSTFSIFVEPLREDSLKEGTHQHGATVVVVRVINADNAGRVVTVVGEIPLHTAQKVAAAF
ncbi:sigma E regulatory protein, MucB/RseB [Oceanospirillum multiglobuliferum]|uniref:Transcriptional regulator n=1 Tax=Oceanospirillum multiglobuliferum TaxID=64969 RepID=A0A1T4KLB9_9GAMM|nr:MucB/RseB C-terminal domain-containing protein [Oceanospirillum multiglobuliferum]OPX56069.1 hypothetical protein BTE48_05850 [Oceanospirillum multiglobuliferum]SJZ43200.1 sigma E regulatory protein, MucB/RseB [Oceanospirillum multiglobuliferum]